MLSSAKSGTSACKAETVSVSERLKGCPRIWLKGTCEGFRELIWAFTDCVEAQYTARKGAVKTTWSLMLSHPGLCGQTLNREKNCCNL